jgi:hypothetical protein
MANFLFIFEDGAVNHDSDFTQDDIMSCYDGYLELIDITDPAKPKMMTFDEKGESSFVTIESKDSD